MERGRRPLLLVAGIVLLVGSGAWSWVGGADQRRVDAACDTWLEHRSSLRAVLTESQEAAGRARADGAPRTHPFFNDVDTVRESLRRWEAESPRLVASLEGNVDASDLERGAESSFGVVGAGLQKLHDLIEQGTPRGVVTWLPEVTARLQGVDDVCLRAARGV